jgi:hypothetical protein
LNTNGNGGAVTAEGSSLTVVLCRFLNCSAANGGALSATGHGVGQVLDVQNCSFTLNSAVGGTLGCPAGNRSNEPCSTWGGAVAAFEMSNVSIIGCTMAENSALAIVPVQSQQNGMSQNAVAGGGCVSILFRGNSSASSVRFFGNSFLQCNVDVSNSSNIVVGNGIVCCLAGVCPCSCWCFAHITNVQDTAELCLFISACRLESRCLTFLFLISLYRTTCLQSAL